jgi:hypothetical protein
MGERRCGAPLRAWLPAALALALHALPAQAQSGLRLVFDWTKTSSDGGGEAEQTTRGSFTARLGETTLAIRNGDEESVYDFATRRIALLDHASRQRRELSLYAGVDLRAAEIENRRFVVDMLRSVMNEKRDLAQEEIDLGVVGARPVKASARAERLLGAGRGFEALLVTLEQQFALGKPPSELLRRVRDATQDDARTETVLRVIQRGERDPRAALAQLAEVDARGLEGGHVLAILRANQRLTLRETGAAQVELARALAVNPFLMGPLVDAGKIYALGFQLGAARECWDAVRAIAPGRPMLKELDAEDEALRREYPQLF